MAQVAQPVYDTPSGRHLLIPQGARLVGTYSSDVAYGQAQAQEFRNGFFDQTAQVWNQAGVMLATSHQVVYFKE